MMRGGRGCAPYSRRVAVPVQYPRKLTVGSIPGLAAATLPAPAARPTENGPGLPGWGRSPRRSKQVMYCGPREAPPLQYPWGNEPPVSPPRRSDPVTVPRYTGPYWVDPFLARVRAEADGESEALRRNGEVQYHGSDEPPTYAMRDTA